MNRGFLGAWAIVLVAGSSIAFAQERGPRAASSVQLERDIAYAGTENPRQRLDLLLPRDRRDATPLPVVVFIHGGAWRSGDKSGGIGQLTPYVASGQYAGVSVGYRLTDEATWPAQIHDCKAALRWIRANAAKYHLDPQRIGVMGPSAGGHLAAMLGVSGDVPDLEGDLGEHDHAGSRVACVVDLFGPSDLLSMGDFPSRIDHNAADSPESRLIGGAVQQHPDAAKIASPTHYVTADDPPFLLIHGTDDPLVPVNQSERLHAALTEKGVPSLFIKVEGGGHGGFRNPELERRMRLFFDKHLRGQEAEISAEPVKAGAAASAAPAGSR